MVDAFSTALQAALTTFKTDLTTAISDNLAIVLPVGLGLIALGVIWGVVRKFAKAK
jgi:hypothetical protein